MQIFIISVCRPRSIIAAILKRRSIFIRLAVSACGALLGPVDIKIMQKALTIAIAILIVLGVILGVALVFLINPSSNPSQTTDGGSSGTIGSNQTSGGTAGSNTGSSQATSGSNGTQQDGGSSSGDFLHASDTTADPNNEGQYFLAGTGKNNSSAPPYNILYVASDNSFTIALLKEPLRDTRSAAEQALQKTLGISQTEMCNLNYAVLVPYSVNQFYSGQNLGFSFCPNAAAL